MLALLALLSKKNQKEKKKDSRYNDVPPVQALFRSLRPSILTPYPFHSQSETHRWPT